MVVTVTVHFHAVQCYNKHVSLIKYMQTELQRLDGLNILFSYVAMLFGGGYLFIYKQSPSSSYPHVPVTVKC
jgi:hypothetical protein